MNIQREMINLPNGKVIELESGKLAKQADGSVVLKCGNTMMLATVVASKEAKEDVDFLPLTVDYREKFSAAGRFPGGFFKREARPSDQEILVMRLIDRALRPLFPSDFHAEVQVMVSLISYDPADAPESLAGLAASAAIAVSDIPFNGPMSEVRIGRKDGEFIINPSAEELLTSELDVMVAGTADSIVMVEGEMLEISEDEMLDAIKFAHDIIKTQVTAQLNLASKYEKAATKREYNHEKSNEDLKKSIFEFTLDKFKEVARKGSGKEERSAAFAEIKEGFLATLDDETKAENKFLISQYIKAAQKEGVRHVILEEKVRLDGRKTDEVRDIWSEVDYLPNAHGSAIFTRGETQSLTSLTLGSKLDAQSIDTVSYVGSEKFILHYNFPPFSTGEARPLRGTSRREIGHGNLAFRALKNMIPDGEENPYTIRLVSDILESNGSSSMATVCAGTLALMDGGIPIKRPVSGIAMGLITNDDNSKYTVLSDILGDEDHLGDMDFKVCGTEKGITACQMDIKINGLDYEMLRSALYQAREGRSHILGEVLKCLPEVRTEFKANAPRIERFEVPKESIGAIIGPGGKIIQELQATTGATITIEEANGAGQVEVSGVNQASVKDAVERIKNIAMPRVVEVGETFSAKVKSIMPYGAFMELIPGTDGLLHISEISHKRLEKVEEELKIDDTVDVKVIGKDPKSGKLKLSRKVLLEKPVETTAE
jgi:polyribonucleotide nucleotidyltransferase